MDCAKVCLVLCACVVLCGVGRALEQEQLVPLAPPAPLAADLVDAGENSQADVDLNVEGTRKARQYFGPPPPPFFGPPPPPYYGGGFGGFGGGYGGYGGYGFGGGYQRTRVVTRTRYRGGFGGFGGGYYG
ncbi:5'-3' exoribonuclease 2 [Drosophila innubila]|uniref:5'-3' exoribonuclease 2 n=1 Tax=Drosophila innubila TaxID=198719 RepID=UPI00148B6098|nr:5'-3' exoribonuclease 2 [Drosophila innubila]